MLTSFAFVKINRQYNDEEPVNAASLIYCGNGSFSAFGIKLAMFLSQCKVISYRDSLIYKSAPNSKHIISDHGDLITKLFTYLQESPNASTKVILAKDDFEAFLYSYEYIITIVYHTKKDNKDELESVELKFDVNCSEQCDIEGEFTHDPDCKDCDKSHEEPDKRLYQYSFNGLGNCMWSLRDSPLEMCYHGTAEGFLGIYNKKQSNTPAGSTKKRKHEDYDAYDARKRLAKDDVLSTINLVGQKLVKLYELAYNETSYKNGMLYSRELSKVVSEIRRNLSTLGSHP